MFSYVLIIAIAITLAVIIANKKNRSAFVWGGVCFLLPILVLVLLCLPRLESATDKAKSVGLKETYINRYTSNEEVFRHNPFLSHVFQQLCLGNHVELKDLNEAFSTMAIMENA